MRISLICDKKKDEKFKQSKLKITVYKTFQ